MQHVKIDKIEKKIITHTHTENKPLQLTRFFCIFLNIWPLLFHHPLCYCLFFRWPPCVQILGQLEPDQPVKTPVKTTTLLPPSARFPPRTNEPGKEFCLFRRVRRVAISRKGFCLLRTWDLKCVLDLFHSWTQIGWWRRHRRSQRRGKRTEKINVKVNF